MVDVYLNLTIYDLIEFYYKDLENTTGGNLHIVLDDGNLNQNSISYCQERALQEGDTFGYFLATLLRAYSEKDLEEMYNENWGLRG